MKTLVAVAQMCSRKNKAKNLERCEYLIEEARGHGVKFISFPENFAFLGEDEHEAKAAAEYIDGASITRLARCAHQQGMWLSLGGFQEKLADDGKIANTHVVVSDVGRVVAVYRKMHLFSVKLPNGAVYDEARSVRPGSEVVNVATNMGRFGLSICYDLRFAPLYQALRDQGADIMLVPAAFSDVTGPAHWEILLRARAIETQSYVLAAAQTGRHNPTRVTHGHACIVDPWGAVIAQCGLEGHLAFAEINLELVRKLRTDMPIWQQRALRYE